jgi:prophage regulatory protein
MMPDADADRFIALPEVSRRVGLGKTMIYKMIADGRFPPPYKITPAAARWSNSEVTAWIADVKFGYEGKLKQIC